MFDFSVLTVENPNAPMCRLNVHNGNHDKRNVRKRTKETNDTAAFSRRVGGDRSHEKSKPYRLPARVGYIYAVRDTRDTRARNTHKSCSGLAFLFENACVLH